MTLPKINVPEYSLVVPSTNEEIKFIPLGRDYQGAGYALKVDFDTIIKKLK